ncbi:MAG: hypothetical protein WBG69_11680 [Arcobacteraceae bacterium]
MITFPTQLEQTFTNLKQLNPKDYGIRKKLDIFTAQNNADEETLILHIVQKSRFLQKDVDKIEEIVTLLNIEPHSKSILIESPLCSKAKAKLENNNWSVTN